MYLPLSVAKKQSIMCNTTRQAYIVIQYIHYSLKKYVITDYYIFIGNLINQTTNV